MEVHNSMYAEQTDDNIYNVYKAQEVMYVGGSEVGHFMWSKCIIPLP